MLRGRLLTESLRVGADVRVPSLRVVRVGRHDVSASTSADQPKVWTFLDFEAPDEVADEVAAALAESLVSDQGWYADFEVGDDHVVVFPGRVFRYTKGDRAGRHAAVEYGRSAGVPSHQLDWGE
ncbi:hypothetical protein HNR22_001608 [Micromonospora jinlongensis]|uniref:Uncharacterized protein n=1 Tax=Micromonospora jinlongensis TaxID=1287877 RepID=A0A7Y9WYH1_9ACTN|nr:hypothetical protein [Micromonospora jinlongensis]NYH41881.1 hypothetical protein [Micromonospora jinlongensis]